MENQHYEKLTILALQHLFFAIFREHSYEVSVWLNWPGGIIRGVVI